jgi:hypothetical protein
MAGWWAGESQTERSVRAQEARRRAIWAWADDEDLGNRNAADR